MRVSLGDTQDPLPFGRPRARNLCAHFCYLEPELEQPLEACLAAYETVIAGGSPSDRRRVEASAVAALVGAQDILAQFEGGELVTHWRIEVPRVQLYARTALTLYMTGREAQALVTGATGRPLLAVCSGKEARVTRFKTVDQANPNARIAIRLSPHGDGCGLVVPARTVRSTYCTDCKDSDANKQRKLEAESRARLAGRTPALSENGARVWQGPCSCCSKAFTNPRPDASRCADCRTHGRSPQRATRG